MRERLTVVTRKGQVTVPVEVRRALGLKQGDRIAFTLEGNEARIRPARSLVAESYQAIPALGRSMTLREMTEIAHEVHAQEAAREGLPQR